MAIPEPFAVNLYADDTAITTSAKTPNELEAQLNQALKIVYDWFRYIKLSLNLKKTFYTVFATPAKCKSVNNIKVKFGNEQIHTSLLLSILA